MSRNQRGSVDSTDTEWPMGTVAERLVALEDIIFAAVCEGIDAGHLSRQRDKLYWRLEEGDHS